MKKLLLLMMITMSMWAGSVEGIKAQLISKIATALVDKPSINLYILDDNYQNLDTLFYRINQVPTCQAADMVIAHEMQLVQTFCGTKTPLILMTSYREYKQSPLAIGALFWQKGRPNLILNAQNIEVLSIKPPKEFSKYFE